MVAGGGKKGNTTAGFGADIFLEGVTGVPNLLLKYYSKLAISAEEMMLIINLIYLYDARTHRFPNEQDVAEALGVSANEVKSFLAGLIEKGMIGILPQYCAENDAIFDTYSFEPLFEKISEIWAVEKYNSYLQMKKALKQEKNKERQSAATAQKQTIGRVCKAFEKEFGRLLSPMEMEQINNWLNDFKGNSELIMEALKRAVLLGKHNFKYIDSILLEWYKNCLFSIDEVEIYEANFRQRQTNTVKNRKKPEEQAKVKDKFRLLYLR